MKVLTKNIYYFKEPATAVDQEMIGKRLHKIRIWHDCSNFKGGKRGITRAELNITNVEDETATYTCPHCGFEKDLDLNLNLA